MMNSLSIVGDIGGTNARFAVVEQGSSDLQHIQILQCANYSCMSAAVDDYMQSLQHAKFDRAAIAFACPVEGDRIKMSNNHWNFEKKDLKKWLDVDHLSVLNDFTAMALGVTQASEADVVMVKASASPAETVDKPKLVIGAGTGLGVSALIPDARSWLPLTTEGGHVEFAPTDELEMEILRFLMGEFGRVSVERLLSGAGIYNIYKALCHIESHALEYDRPAEIIEAANNQHLFCKRVLLLFSSIFGRVAGNATLTLGAFGGVYICGGVIPRFLDIFLSSEFAKTFEEKGRMSKVLQNVRVDVVTDIFAGLKGSAVSLTHPSFSRSV